MAWWNDTFWFTVKIVNSFRLQVMHRFQDFMKVRIRWSDAGFSSSMDEWACKMTKWERVNGCRPRATLMLQISKLHSSYKPTINTSSFHLFSMSVAACSCRRVSSLRCSSCTLPNDVAHCKTVSVLALNSHLEKANHCKLLALPPRNHISYHLYSSR